MEKLLQGNKGPCHQPGPQVCARRPSRGSGEGASPTSSWEAGAEGCVYCVPVYGGCTLTACLCGCACVLYGIACVCVSVGGGEGDLWTAWGCSWGPRSARWGLELPPSLVKPLFEHMFR